MRNQDVSNPSRLGDIFDALQDIVYFRDLDGVILEINRAGEQFFGRPRNSIVGQTLHRERDDPAAVSLEATNRRLAELGVDRSTVVTTNALGETRILETTTTLLRDEHGNPARACGVMRDITDSVHLRESLERLNLELRTLAEHLTEEQSRTAQALQEARLARVEATRQKEIAEQAMERIAEDHARKTVEIEEARVFQVSLLPRDVPAVDGFDIAAYMKTASEVGGDYYDFAANTDGLLSIAVGDATGHGLRAGMLVATAKSYFQSLANRSSPAEMLQTMNAGFLSMKLRTLFMSMAVARVEGAVVRLAVAGMPPVLLFRAKERIVEHAVEGGMPLGVRADPHYEERTIQLEPGDGILMLSDGLPELFDSRERQLGYGRIIRALASCADLTAAEVVAYLVQVADEWSGASPQDDDLTLVFARRL